MEAKVSIKNLFLLIIPLISWGFLAWFRLERQSQLIAYPLSFLFVSSIYYFNLKVNKLIFKLSSLKKCKIGFNPYFKKNPSSNIISFIEQTFKEKTLAEIMFKKWQE